MLLTFLCPECMHEEDFQEDDTDQGMDGTPSMDCPQCGAPMRLMNVEES